MVNKDEKLKLIVSYVRLIACLLLHRNFGNKEINNNNHLCFPFITRSFSDLTSFDIFLQDNTNKKIEFKSGEKKISISNFQIDIFLT